MQIKRFTNGGYVIHKMLLQHGKGWFSAWYDKDGVLLDAEQFFDHERTRSVKRPGPAWNTLAAIGKRFAQVPA